MKPAAFGYRAPAEVEEAVRCLADEPDAKVLAGGQSLMPLLNFRLARPGFLVDINRLPLDYVAERDGGIAIGALARQSAVETSPVVRKACPLLADALRLVAHPVIRNRGTVVGSVVHADPAAELPAVMLVLDGRLTVTSAARGVRTIAADQLFEGPLQSALEPDELALEAWFPAFTGTVAIAEEARRHGDFALAGAVRAGDRLALFGVAPTPVLVDPAAPTQGLRPSSDLEASSAFRLHLVNVLAAQVLAL
jgi:carbon-monoxide dehydrogenase medium subunit